jgi:hypothetical protein
MKDVISMIRKTKNLGPTVRMINKEKCYYDIIKGQTNFLDKNVSLKERLFNIKNYKTDVDICPICKIDELEWNLKYSKYKNTCSNKLCKNTYSLDNRDIEKEKERRNKISINQKNKSKEEKRSIRYKIKKTNIDRYGVDSYAKSNQFKEHMKENYGYVSAFELKGTHEKSRETLIKKYGCDHNFKIKEVKEKRKTTFIEKYETETPSENLNIKNKIIDTNNERYGGNSPMCNDNIKNKAKTTYNKNYIDNLENKNALMEKREKTMLENYGVRYWIQSSENADKLLKSRKNTYKKYTFNNKEIYLQGYENYALFEIFMKKYDIDDIFISKKDIENIIGKIYYEHENKKHRYYPDFYIKSENKIYEIKSNYTYNNDIDINIIKKKCCENMGINFDFIIVDNKDYRKWLKNN